MTEDEFRGHDALGDQVLGAVQVRQQGIEQLCALLHAGFDGAPFVGRDQQWQRIELPGPIAPLRVGVDVVGDAILHDQPSRHLDATAHRFGPAVGKMFDQRLPVRADRTVSIEQLIVALRTAGIEQLLRIGHRAQGLERHL